VVGTISAFRPDSAEIEVKPDNAAAVAFKVTADTIAQRVAPGSTDLKSAAVIKVTDVMLGDRVLATPETGTKNLRRIVVMSANDIAKRNDADRADWTRRGVSGVVAAKSGDTITLKLRTMMATSEAVVTITDKTTFKRYAPDSVKFADAKASRIAEVSVGDQLRARGQKSEDGLKVTADEVVFGTFQTRAGEVTAVNAEAKEITVKDLGTSKPVTIHFTADSQVKKMPDMGAMMAAMHGGGGPPGGAPGGPPGAPGGGRGMDVNAMLDRMPAAKIEDLKPGETIVVTSTKGAKTDHLTAIMLLGNAGMVVQMAAAQAGGGRAGGGMGQGGGMGMGGMMGGGMDALGGMGLGGIIP